MNYEEKIEILFFWMHEQAKLDAQVIECEEGSASFITLANLNGYTQRVKRALTDDDYFNHLTAKYRELLLGPNDE